MHHQFQFSAIIYVKWIDGEAQLVRVRKIKRDYPEILNNDKKLQLESRIEYVAKQKCFENVAIKNSRRK